MAAAKTALTASEQAAVKSWLVRHWVTLASIVGGLVAAGFLFAWLNVSLVWWLWLLMPALLWVFRLQAGVWVWMETRRRLLAKHATACPPLLQLLREYYQHQRRVAYVRRQWESFCGENHLTGFGKAVPWLYSVKPNVDLDLVAHIKPGDLGVKGGMAPFRKAASDIAVACKCPGGVRFRETSIGAGTVTFMWSNLLERELPIASMPQGPYDRIAYGITDGGDVMSIKMALSAYIVGMTESGKSKVLRALLVDLKRKNIQTHIYAIDPKRQELSKFAPLVHQSRGSLHFKGYTKSVDGAARMVADLVEVMHKRQDAMTEAGFDEWEEKLADRWPLIVVPIDEVLELMMTWKADAKTKSDPKGDLNTILSQCRAAGMMVLILSQVAHKEVLGLSRSLVPQRVVLKMESPLETGMAFGDSNAEDKGAKCSEIHEPGMGYQWSSDQRGYAPFRSALCVGADWDRVLAGDELPAGMLEKDRAVAEAYLNYRFYTSDRQPLRTGITNNFERRYAEYRRDYEREAAEIAAGVLDPDEALHWWVPFHDPAQTVITEAKDKAEAKKIESALISQGVWRGNHQENMRSELRNIPPPAPDSTRWWSRSAKPEAETPDNVTPIRRRPVAEDKPTRRRRA